MKISGLLLIILVFVLSSSCLAEHQSNPKVIIRTIFGKIAVELFPDDAPITVDNFLQYVNSGFYDDLIFHRVIENFMIQGGGFEPGPVARTEGLGAPIINESYNGLSNLRGTIAMARTSEPNSATSQFFINHVDNSSSLDRDANGVGYCVFGRVTSGMDVVDFIAQIPTYTLDDEYGFPMDDVPIYTDLQDNDYWVYVIEVFEGLREDFNNDGIVNFQDFALLASVWNKPVTERLEEDLDASGTIDLPDLLLFTDRWLSWYSVLEADINKNGIVNFEDFALLASRWMLPANRKQGDWDISGSIGFGDLRILAGDWLKQTVGYE